MSIQSEIDQFYGSIMPIVEFASWPATTEFLNNTDAAIKPTVFVSPPYMDALGM